MQLLGKPVAQKIEKKDIFPQTKTNHCHLAIILVGQDPKSEVYIREKIKTGRVLGLKVSVYKFSANEEITKIQETVRYLNEDDDISGIIIQLPLPANLISETNQLLNLIQTKKDVDSLTLESQSFREKINLSQPASFSTRFPALKKLYQEKKIFLPPTATAVFEIINFYKIKPKNIAVIGQGLLVGEPVQRLLDQMQISYRVIHLDTETIKKAQILKTADLIITGTSSKNPIFSPLDLARDTVVIDCATDFDHNVANKRTTKIFFTPAIGGVGPVTVACLLRNVVLAELWQNRN